MRHLFVAFLLTTVWVSESHGFQIPQVFSSSNKNKQNNKNKPTTVTKYIDGDRMLDKVEYLPEILDKHPIIDSEFVEHLQVKEDACLPNCEHGWFTSVYKGAKLHYRRFLPKGKVKGIVVWMHGITSFSGVAFVDDDGRKINMALLSEQITKQGYACYAFDMYGHGYSEGIRHYVRNWKHNLKDYQNFVDLVVQQHSPDTPLFLCGESYGGCLTLHLAQHFQDHPEERPEGFDSILLLAPAIQAVMPPRHVYLTLRYGLAPLFPRWIPFFMPHPVHPDRIWRDAKVRALHDDEISRNVTLGGGGKPFRLGTAASMLDALKMVRKHAIPQLSVPFGVVHGASDHAVPIEGTEFLLEHAQTPEEDRDMLRLEGAYHDLLADPDAEATVQFCTQWIQKRLDKRNSLAADAVEKEELASDDQEWWDTLEDLTSVPRTVDSSSRAMDTQKNSTVAFA
ncbi:Monoglyceride lipase [Seminavis robusta]|uniref:Monoglyceride lipase n=1 Tax=Seminavis robusta TaxID=568900 RepID=A0A9N8HD07_9STRA|nr:Monoglyceride lipase [Seminavis robusta]|eukprot:Sro437_g142800.1 Monoglyceride lipase (452) ;mRNA; f:18487-19842